MNKLDAEIRKQLSPSEELIWCGKPQQGIIFTGRDIPTTIIYSIFTGFALFILSMFLRSASLPYIFYYGAVAFAIIACYLLFGRFIEQAHLRKKTWYALTSQRILISYGPYSGKPKSFSLHLAILELPPQAFSLTSLPDVKLEKVNNQGIGTINFGLPYIYRSFWGGRGGDPAVVIYPKFELVANAREVYEKIIDARRQCQSGNEQRH